MKIAVLVSGGVDSSVALRLLKEQGHELTAFYLKVWLEDELSHLGNCPWQEDLQFIEELCQQIDVPLEIKSVQQEYHERVVGYTLAEIRAGRTPSPDLFCNQMIKFGVFFDLIDDSYEKIATGHYAQIEERAVAGHAQFFLKRAVDGFKDQTYFLSRLSQAQLARIIFPIGHLQKQQVRALAEQYDVPSKNRKDSQGICFLGNINFADFIKYHQGVRPGNFIEYETGAVIGKHEGFWFYTIGQRRGMGLSGGPWYVVKKDIERNDVYISRRYHEGHLVRNRVTITDLHWLIESIPVIIDFNKKLEVKLRHGEYLYQATLDQLTDKIYALNLAGHDQGIAPGQFAVLYEGDYVLGSARICLEEEDMHGEE